MAQSVPAGLTDTVAVKCPRIIANTVTGLELLLS